ncbi:MAG TPA: UDP-N-acetylmuramoyl-L-alanine--D-glutamate ligase [Planctomycetes bacterium]|nr:UDP-N-acetylmuramoyl-L-alanine--D-glutamate ligase [Planctomycetota bacterium]
MIDFEGARALVMGLGRFGGGVGAVRYLVERGAEVTVTDLSAANEIAGPAAVVRELGVRAVFGEHRASDFEGLDLLVVNPAVPPDTPLVAHARDHGARITSAIELFLDAVPARVACVTGTQGKSSTCHILAQLLEGTGNRVHLGGNFGGSLLERLGREADEGGIAEGDFVVLELSSYQLEALAAPPPGRDRVEVVAVTNVLADHLERHGSVQAYGAAKRRILELLNEDGSAILPEEGAGAVDWNPARGRRIGRGSREGGAVLSRDDENFRLEDELLGRIADVRLPGAFQLDNVLTALGMARCLGVAGDQLVRALPRVAGLEHRLELLPPVAGRLVHDNGVSTTPDSTLTALESLPAGIVLLCGGRMKRLSYDELFAAAARRGDRVVCFGEAGAELCRGFERAGAEAIDGGDLATATARALDLTSPGSALLFSPACTSFDGFSNFKDRALAFRAALGATAPAMARVR